MRYLTPLLFLLIISCHTDGPKTREDGPEQDQTQIKFDKEMWLTKEGEDYPFRDQMYNDVLYNDTIRSLNKGEILELLGQPDRINNDHLYYTISQKRIFGHPLHTKTMVVKLDAENGVEWIKVHK